MILLPLTDSTNQESEITLQGIGLIYRVYYSTKYDYWSLDVLTLEGDAIFTGAKIVLGSIAPQYMTDIRLPLGQFVGIDLVTDTRVPNRSQLGTTSQIYFISTEELYA